MVTRADVVRGAVRSGGSISACTGTRLVCAARGCHRGNQQRRDGKCKLTASSAAAAMDHHWSDIRSARWIPSRRPSPIVRRAHQGQARRNGCPRSVRRRHGASRGSQRIDLRSRYRRRDLRLVGETGAAPRARRSFTCMAAGSTGNRPRVPEFRRPHRIERWS